MDKIELVMESIVETEAEVKEEPEEQLCYETHVKNECESDSEADFATLAPSMVGRVTAGSEVEDHIDANGAAASSAVSDRRLPEESEVEILPSPEAPKDVHVGCSTALSDPLDMPTNTATAEPNCYDNRRRKPKRSKEVVQCKKRRGTESENEDDAREMSPAPAQSNGKHLCECGKSFPFLCRLKAHKRSHTGEKLYVCEICGSSFVRSNYLKCHIRTHTGERPFICDLCGATFTRSNNLNVHKRIHTGVKPFACKVCAKTFGLRYDLVTHMRSHSGEKPYKCRMCDKAFSQGSNRKVHERRHMGLKPFACDMCGASFAKVSLLQDHYSCHTENKPFECQVCEKRFVRKCNLINHMRTHPKESSVS